jgi:hypothetical protein
MDAWEASIRHHARLLVYPSTPDVSRGVMAQLASYRTQKQGRRFPLSPFPLSLRSALWVATILIAALIGLWSVPPVRAAILEFLQIGAVRIWLVEPTPVPTSRPPATAAALSTPIPPTPRIETASPFNLAGQTTLENAEAQAGFAIPLPTYPQGIGLPDAVFYQELDGPVVVLMWLDEEQPEQPLYSLHILGDNVLATKANPLVVETTSVNGQSAAWTNGPYLLTYGEGSATEWQLRYLVSGRVLIWEENGLTYRLESNMSMEEAVRMAESLQPQRP